MNEKDNYLKNAELDTERESFCVKTPALFLFPEARKGATGTLAAQGAGYGIVIEKCGR